MRVRGSRVIVACAASVIMSVVGLGGVSSADQPSQPGSVGVGPQAPVSVPIGGTRSLPPTVSYIYQPGSQVLFSSTPDGTGSTTFSTSVLVSVQHPDGSVATFRHDYQDAAVQVPFTIPPVWLCPGPPAPLAPVDVSSLFAPGRNVVSVVAYDINDPWCGSASGTGGPAYLVPARVSA